LAQAFTRLGSDVTVLEREDQILPDFHKKITKVLLKILKKEGVKIELGVEISGVDQDVGGFNIHYQQKGKAENISSSQLLVCVGRTPNIEDLQLGKIKLNVNQNGIIVNKRLKTNINNIFAVGDVTKSSYVNSHVAEYQASLVISQIAFRWPRSTDYRIIPSVVYTDPEIARVGVYNNEKSNDVEIMKCRFTDIDRAVINGEKEGFVRIVVKNKKIISAQMIGFNAGELINEFSLMMKTNMNIRHLAETIHPYPTLSQINRKVVRSYYSKIFFSERTKRIVRFINRLFRRS
jgi:pyruvate/2-oxoglutarate dehydrogenase complex dihydrolipoamide dehydrogenase (E3) component